MKETLGPSFISEPQIQYLSRLLEEIRQGLLRVPRFQRPFIWNLSQRIELLRSIRDSIPIGSIMVWRTHRTDITTHRFLGPHRLPESPSGEGHVRQYILDGVQRLSTLYGTLYPPEPVLSSDEDESEDSIIYFDLKTRDFVTSSQDSISSQHIPLTLLLDSVGLLKFQRNIKGEDADLLVERADEIARAFREYKVPVLPIATNDPEMATRTFQRINSQGTVMSEVHMVNALTWTTNFDLLARLEALKEEHLVRVGWGDLDDDLIIKTCKAALELDLYDSSVEELSKQLRSQPSVLDQSVRNLSAAAMFLAGKCLVAGPGILPYGLQIVLIADSFRKYPLPDKSRESLLVSWFWMTTFGELFAGISSTRLSIVMDKLRETLQQRVLTWPGANPFRRRPLALRFDMRSARSRAVAIGAAYRRPLDSSGNPVPAAALLAREGTKAFIHLVPRNELPPEMNRLYASPANRLLVLPEDAYAIQALIYQGSPTEDFLRSHLLDSSDVQDLRNGKAGDFLLRRAQRLEHAEERAEKVLKERLGLQAP